MTQPINSLSTSCCSVSRGPWIFVITLGKGFVERLEEEDFESRGRNDFAYGDELRSTHVTREGERTRAD